MSASGPGTEPLVLVMETSCARGGVALMRGEEPVAVRLFEEGMTHGRALLSVVCEVLAGADVGLREVDVFAVDAGPGSFTGLRIGAVAAKTLAWALEKPLAVALSVDALGAACLSSGVAPPVACLMDAYRGLLYGALYAPERVFLELLEPSEALARLPADATVVGDGRARYPEIPVHVGRLAFRAWRRGETVDPFEFVPLYMRRSEAEERRGVDASPESLA